MKKKQFINEVRQLQKIAGILKEEGGDQNAAKKIFYGLESGDSLINLIDDIRKAYPEYVEKIIRYDDMEQEIYGRAMSDKIDRITKELDAGASLINIIDVIRKVYPAYVDAIQQYNDMEHEIYDRAMADSK